MLKYREWLGIRRNKNGCWGLGFKYLKNTEGIEKLEVSWGDMVYTC